MGSHGPLSATDAENTFAPLWHLADALLPSAARAQYGQQLRSILNEIRLQILTPGAGAPFSASVGSEALQIARANGISWQLDTATIFGDTVSGDGYLSLTSDGAFPDPQLTFEAAAFGMAPSTALIATIRRTAGVSGWRAMTGSADPATSFYALMVARAIGSSDHEGALRAQTSIWLGALAAVGGGANPTSLRTTFFVLDLANSLHLQVPSEVAATLTSYLHTSAADATDDPALLIGISQLNHQPPPAAVRAALARAAGASKPASMGGALQDWLLSSVTGDRQSQRNAVRIAEMLESNGRFRAVAASPLPDLLSTTVGIMITAALIPARLAALRPFQTATGTSLLPAQVSNGNLTSPLTLYLGYLALGRVKDPSGVLAQQFSSA
jgi:hypothetical protein